MQLFDPFVERRLTRETLELVEDVGRKGLPTARRSFLQRTMQSVGDVANLKHLRHAWSMYSIEFACKRFSCTTPSFRDGAVSIANLSYRLTDGRLTGRRSERRAGALDSVK